MVFTNCTFDPVVDISPVDQFGFIDLKNALANSIVPSQMPESETDYNGMDDPSKILGTPRDIFEAMDAQKALETVQASGDEQSDKNE